MDTDLIINYKARGFRYIYLIVLAEIFLLGWTKLAEIGLVEWARVWSLTQRIDVLHSNGRSQKELLRRGGRSRFHLMGGLAFLLFRINPMKPHLAGKSQLERPLDPKINR
jgi:hypothetical protein